jgi:hypothetical protein
MKLLKLLEGLYHELKTYNENVAQEKQKGRNGGRHYVTGMSSPEYCWIKFQLHLRNIPLKEIEAKTGYSNSYVSLVLNGNVRCEKIEAAFAEMLGYESFEKLWEAACRQTKGETA